MALLLTACTTVPGEDRRLGWVCSAEANDGPVRASSHQSLDFDGAIRKGSTELDLTLVGNQPARLFIDWNSSGAPEVAEGRFRFRTSRPGVPAEPGQLTLVVGNTVIARSASSPGMAEVAVSGRTLSAPLAAGAAIGLRLLARNGRALGSASLDRGSFDLAVQKAREASGAVLAKAADYQRLCQREQRITVT